MFWLIPHALRPLQTETHHGFANKGRAGQFGAGHVGKAAKPLVPSAMI